MRIAALSLAALLLASSCGNDDATPTATSGTDRLTPLPTTAVPDSSANTVEEWLDAVIASDTARLTDLVEPAGLVVLAAVENSYTPGQMDLLLAGELPAEFVEEYWTSFRAGFIEFAGIPLQSIAVGAVDEFTLDNVDYAGVMILSGDAGTTVITRHRGDTWRVDLVASFGAAFAAQLRRMLLSLGDGAVADRVRVAFRQHVIPSLVAASRRDPDNDILAAELERMTLFLELD